MQASGLRGLDTTAGSEGEISPLDAECLEDQAAAVAKPTTTAGYGDDNDAKAVRHVVDYLRKTPAMRGKSEEELIEKAEDMYVMVCQKIVSGTADHLQIAKMAQLVGEEVETLKARLTSAA